MIVLLSLVIMVGLLVIYVTPWLIYVYKSDYVSFHPVSDGDLPYVSIVVPTFNEESIIIDKLTDLMRLDYPSDKLEVVFVDSSSDRTSELIGSYNGRFRLRIIVENERKGLATALNLGYSDSKGEIVVKSDCDAVSHDEQALKKLVSHFQDPHIGGVSCVYSNSYEALEGSYRGLLTRLQSRESNLDSTIIAHGAFVGFRRKLIEPIDSQSAADDTELFVKIRKKGYRCIVDPTIVFQEIRPQDAYSVRSQRSRRAYGIIRVIFSNLDALFNPNYGKYGLIVFPSNFFMLVLFPPLFIATGLLFVYGLLSEFGIWGILISIFLVVAWVFARKTGRPRELLTFVDTQEVALLGLFLFLSRKPKHVWKKAR